MDKTSIIRLIIADDNPHARHGLQAVLTAHPGIEVCGEASQGQEAIALAAEKKPDVALLDVRMPVLDGIETARLMKERWPKIRIVLISMYADYQVEALESGADVFLVKGCPANELIKAVTDQQTDSKPLPPKEGEYHETPD